LTRIFFCRQGWFLSYSSSPMKSTEGKTCLWDSKGFVSCVWMFYPFIYSYNACLLLYHMCIRMRLYNIYIYSICIYSMYMCGVRVYSLAPTLSHTSTITNPHMHGTVPHVIILFTSWYPTPRYNMYTNIIYSMYTFTHSLSNTSKSYTHLRVVNPAFKHLVIWQMTFCSSYLRIPLFALSLQESYTVKYLFKEKKHQTIPHKSGPMMFFLGTQKKT